MAITFATSLLSFQRRKEKESDGLCSEKLPRRQMRKAGGAILNRVETSRTPRFMKPWAFILSSRWIVMMMEIFASCIAWFGSPKVLLETPLLDFSIGKVGTNSNPFESSSNQNLCAYKTSISMPRTRTLIVNIENGHEVHKSK